MNSKTVTCIEDLRQLQKKSRKPFRLSTTARIASKPGRESSGFRKIKFRQRVLIDVSNRSTSTVPWGGTQCRWLAIGRGGFNADGDYARRARTRRHPHTLSIMSICSMGMLRVPSKTLLVSAELLKDRGRQFFRTRNCREMRRDCLTVDLLVLCNAADIKNGMTVPPKYCAFICNVLLARRWQRREPLTTRQPSNRIACCLDEYNSIEPDFERRGVGSKHMAWKTDRQRHRRRQRCA